MTLRLVEINPSGNGHVLLVATQIHTLPLGLLPPLQVGFAGVLLF